MLTTVEVRTDHGTLLQLPLGDISQGYALEKVTGLDPVKATLVSSSFAELDGSQFQSSRREARNLVFTIELVPDYVGTSAESLRQNLYRYMMPEARVYLRFITDTGLSLNITGRVESFDTELFDADSIVTISVMCFNPDFSSTDEETVAGNTVATSVETLIDYDGTVESGIEFTLNVNRSLAEFTIYARAADNLLKTLQFSEPLVSGDVLKIRTVPGDKGAWLTRSGVETSLLYGISPFANWVSLFQGANYIRVYAEGAAIPYTIKYTTKYGAL